MKKVNIAVVFGGRSPEHEVSVISSSHVIEELKKDKKYNVFEVGITREGKWLTGPRAVESFKKIDYKGLSEVDFAVDGSKSFSYVLKGKKVVKKIDAVFCWVLGPGGEDGALPGVFEVANLPYVGFGVFGSSAGFNKAVTKIVMKGAGIPQVAYEVFDAKEFKLSKKEIVKKVAKLGLPIFVKPASCGSSIGISKVKKLADFEKAVNFALKFDDTIVVERGVSNVKEIECAVIGDSKKVKVSLPGEVHFEGEFYDYNAKYVSKFWEIDIPPKIPKAKIKEVQVLVERVFKALNGTGLARVDFLMDGKTGKIYFNEINTIPSFRRESCYATLMAKVGMSYKQIIDRLIEIAFNEYERRNARNFVFEEGKKWMKSQE